MKINTAITIQFEHEEEISQEQIDKIERGTGIKVGSKEYKECFQEWIGKILQDEMDGKIVRINFPKTIIALSEK